MKKGDSVLPWMTPMIMFSRPGSIRYVERHFRQMQGELVCSQACQKTPPVEVTCRWEAHETSRRVLKTLGHRVNGHPPSNDTYGRALHLAHMKLELALDSCKQGKRLEYMKKTRPHGKAWEKTKIPRIYRIKSQPSRWNDFCARTRNWLSQALKTGGMQMQLL